MATAATRELLRSTDIRNPELLVMRLLDADYAPSRLILDRLPGDLVDTMRTADALGEYTPSLQAELLAGMNDRIVMSSSPLPISEFTQDLLTSETKSEGFPVSKMSRRLLAEAFPSCIQVEYSRAENPNEWFKYYIAKFQAIMPWYKRLDEHLTKQLQAACKELAPLAIVQSRLKSIESFAEKVWRKDKYENPLGQITDLCGMRVITETDAEVERINEYIKRVFLVDTVNSDDTRDRLSFMEFGYSAVHFVVHLPPKDPKAGKLYGLKAEVQVKTLLQHAWSSIMHDRIYKSDFEAPTRIKRDLHRIAAVLEESDKAFGRTVNELDEYRAHYGAYLKPPEIKKEIETQQAILDCTKFADQRSVRLKIARLHKAIWRWRDVADILAPLLAAEENPLVLAEHGHALCRVHCESPRNPEYHEGTLELERAKALASADKPANQRADICSYLAWVYANAGKHGNVGLYPNARDNYREAYELDSTDPYNLASYVEFELYCAHGREFLQYMRVSLQRAIDQCNAHIQAGIEIPWAFFTIGRCYLLLDDFTSSLDAYCKGIAHYLSPDCHLPAEFLETEREFLKNINFARRLPEHDQWVDSLLLITQYLRTGEHAAYAEIESRKKHDLQVKPPLIMVAGGADAAVEPRMHLYREYLSAAFANFHGTVVSGGTTSGIPGLIAEIVGAENKNKTEPSIKLLGYIPDHMPNDAASAPEYTLFQIPGSAFTAEQPMQVWIDLIAKKIDPRSAVLLGINGGSVAAFEYRVALAFGAKVGLFRDSGRAVDAIKNDEYWRTQPNLMLLPHDSMVAWAFLHSFDESRPAVQESDPGFVDAAAKAIHHYYVEDNRDKRTYDAYPQFRPWDTLSEGFQKANKSQAQFMITILRLSGYVVVPVAGDGNAAIVNISEDEARKMAEMEHGRWVVERELDGWRFGPQRDDSKRIHPCLLPWNMLSDEVKRWDVNAVRHWPEILAHAKLEVHRAADASAAS